MQYRTKKMFKKQSKDDVKKENDLSVTKYKQRITNTHPMNEKQNNEEIL